MKGRQRIDQGFHVHAPTSLGVGGAVLKTESHQIGKQKK
jgi:hypothetical protein